MEYIRIKDVEVHHGIIGEGRRIIFLHGNPADHRSMMSAFEPVFAEREGWQRVYLDLPGMGQTKGVDWIKGNDDVLDIVLEFIKSVIKDEHFLIVGESYGGYIARGVAHYRSGFIDGMCLLAPVVNPDSSTRMLPEKRVVYSDPEYVNTLSPELTRDINQVSSVHSREVGERLVKDYISAIKISDQPFLQRIREKYAFSFDLNTSAPSYEFPALIMLGRHDIIVGYADQLELHAKFPRGSIAVLDRASHVVELEQPILFKALVNEWLDRVEEYMRTDSSLA